MAKNNSDSFVTIKTLQKTIGEAVDTILKGMDAMFREERKHDLETFATKEDLAETKVELKTEISWLKDDIKGLTTELSNTPSRNEFNKLKVKVDKHLLNHTN